MKTNTYKKEIEKFSKIADEWWDPEGKFKPLHNFNPIRISILKKILLKLSTLIKKIRFYLESILDIGCEEIII